MSEREVEWRFLVRGFALLVAVLALYTAGWAIWRIAYPPKTKFELTKGCLRNEKGFRIAHVLQDPIASSADEGALETTVQGNDVTLAMTTSERRAEQIASDYRAAGAPADRLEQRGRAVYLWSQPPSPTQRQAMYDCAY